MLSLEVNKTVRLCSITTTDNPYDPFTEFTQWLLFDNEKGYCTCSYLARIARCSDKLSDEENNAEIERAIDEIIKYDFRGIYKKVFKPEPEHMALTGQGAAAG